LSVEKNDLSLGHCGYCVVSLFFFFLFFLLLLIITTTTTIIIIIISFNDAVLSISS
jgi:hypothetical protein